MAKPEAQPLIGANVVPLMQSAAPTNYHKLNVEYDVKRAGSQAIPEHVQDQAQAIVERFNKKIDRAHHCSYVARYKGKYLYLDRDDGGYVSHICRLTYTGEMNAWEFTIYKYSDGRYDPEEWFFPGSEKLDGTIEGAMKAGLEAYPP
ncbi:MAG TPA: hypothetical protein VJ793_05240 [Anaerolineae bacterium]|nr:hypothetical protein [Anaerolineae bacterium]